MQAIQRKIVRLGASCAVTLPAPMCKELGLAVGSAVSVATSKHGLLVRPVAPARMTLKERIALSAVDSVRAAGRELVDSPRVGREAV